MHFWNIGEKSDSTEQQNRYGEKELGLHGFPGLFYFYSPD